jgi:hypothetical protein
MMNAIFPTGEVKYIKKMNVGFLGDLTIEPKNYALAKLYIKEIKLLINLLSDIHFIDDLNDLWYDYD